MEKINSTEHPVKVGLSDAFMALLSSPQSPGQLRLLINLIYGTFTLLCLDFFDVPSTDAKRQTIYEYHRVEIDTTKIVTSSAFEFTPLPSE